LFENQEHKANSQITILISNIFIW